MKHLRAKTKVLNLLLASAVTGLVSASAYAQTQASTDKKEGDKDVHELEKFVVTGSYIPYSVSAPAVPIKIYDSEAIAATGETGDLLEVIRKAAPQFVGNGNIGSSNSNVGGGSTNGGSQVKLRNVQTLVLINGRRAAFAPVGASGGYTFVDVNSIPVSAVDKIEILSDGASAIYGSDAVSGVVNIILKKDFDGVEVSGDYRVADRTGHWEQRSSSFVTGAHSGNTSITVSAEWMKSDPVYQSERPFSANQVGKTSNVPGGVTLYGVSGGRLVNLGSYVNADPSKLPASGTHQDIATLVASGAYKGPLTLSSTLNLAPYVTLAMGNERTGFTANIDHKVNNNIQAFGDVLVSRTKTFYQLAAQPIAGAPLTSANVDLDATMNIFGAGVIAADSPINPIGGSAVWVLPRNRFVDHPREYFSDTHTIRVLGGLKGQINEYYSWEAAVNINQVNQEYTNRNVLNRINLGSAIDSGLVNIFAVTQDESKLQQAGVFGTAFSDNDSALNTADLRLNGEIPDVLPAGSIRFAVGVETRKETLGARPDAGSYTNNDITSFYNGQPMLWDGATTTDPFDANRKVDSGFAQLRIPITSSAQKIPLLHTLEFDGAVRYERYSDTDDPVVPKVLLRYLPFNDEFAIRGTWSKAFTAPDLYSMFGPSGVGYTDNLAGLEFLDGRVTSNTADQGVQRSTTNSKLKPEKATNWNVGAIYSPKAVKGLSFEASYFHIFQTNIIGSHGAQSIIQDVELNGTASPYADRVRIGGFAGTPITKAGQISESYDNLGGSFTSVYVTTYPENLISATQDGVDFTTNYDFKFESIGSFHTSLAGVWYNSMRVEDDEFVGTTNGRSVLNGGTVPRWSTLLSLAWERKNLLVGGSWQHIPRVWDTSAPTVSSDPDADSNVPAFNRFDIRARYRFKGIKFLDGLSLTVGINNLTNKMPPMAKTSWTDSGADTGQYGMLGRVYYVNASYRF